MSSSSNKYEVLLDGRYTDTGVTIGLVWDTFVCVVVSTPCCRDEFDLVGENGDGSAWIWKCVKCGKHYECAQLYRATALEEGWSGCSPEALACWASDWTGLNAEDLDIQICWSSEV